MSFLYTAVAFLLALGPLIIFHELGHYWVARACGVKVLRFSVGMGKVVWSRRFGKDQTEWAVSALPLGGYVQFLDSRDPATAPTEESERARDFMRQNVWKRIAIVAAGPAANLLLAIALFAALFMHGLEEPGTKLRPMASNTPAYVAGLRGGDSIVAVNGEPVAGWSDLRWQVTHLAVERQDAHLDVRGANGSQYAATIPAAAMREPGPDADPMSTLGLDVWIGMPVVEKSVEGGAGARAGLLPGDVVLGADGKPFAHAAEFVQAVRAAPGRTLQLQVRRGSQELVLPLTPSTDAKGQGLAAVALAPALERVMVQSGPAEAFVKGARRTWEMTALTFKMIGKIVTGQASLKNITGPIAIADYAGQTARMGLATFLGFIAVVSVSLGVMNLLPIPVLDGGHLLYYSLEVLTGRPLSERIQGFAQRAGVALLFMLMALAIFNDLSQRL
ncbi:MULTISPECIES: RIP metalloprotease RseP [unclassified Massilia]|uniref:RIP metalloprotease RseP n=1 Tax=unclassified Massilia TaxID=2609279 RepID=UPI001781E786|nr:MULTISPECIES: RIP metalloprotease RseP [unclassified Massilia]MBD8530203.1 RIP metalloprotease RseP [Massilia sp. CFBP 13647]MBD8673968.1 RIP metalloprotease RseP [Massilia sp. CFBP 13721]